MKDIVKQVLNEAPKELGAYKDLIHESVELVLERAIHNLDLVPKKDFEAQKHLLSKAMAKLESLETKVKALTKD